MAHMFSSPLQAAVCSFPALQAGGRAQVVSGNILPVARQAQKRFSLRQSFAALHYCQLTRLDTGSRQIELPSQLKGVFP